MRRALRDRLAGYKIPQEMRVVEGIPRNAMGKGEFGVFVLFFEWGRWGEGRCFGRQWLANPFFE